MDIANKSRELSEYITAVAEAVDNGLKDTKFTVSTKDTIVMELVIVNTKKAEGGFKIFVMEAEGQYNREEISKITIPITRRKEKLYPISR